MKVRLPSLIRRRWRLAADFEIEIAGRARSDDNQLRLPGTGHFRNVIA